MTVGKPPPPPTRRPQPPQVAQRQAAPGHLRPAAEQLVPVAGGGFRVRAGESAPRPPTGTYNFVQLHGSAPSSHPVFVSPRLTHAQLAQGKPVVYAGTARFEKGAMEWWSNYSGTYQPVAAFRAQAKLPADKFVPWQTLQLGGHAMQRPMLGERKPAGRPETKVAAKTETKTNPKPPGRPAAAAPGTPAGGAKTTAAGRAQPSGASATAAQTFRNGGKR